MIQELFQMALSPKKIMVVDNHPLIIRFMTDFLQKHGQEVTASPDALSALRLLDEFRPDIFFIDLVMPKISGTQLCKILRSKPEFRDTLIVILSAIAAEEEPNFFEYGADACIAKGPFNRMAEHILALLQRLEKGNKPGDRQILGLENIYERQVIKELLSSRQHFERILAHINEGIIETTAGGTIIFMNPMVQTLFSRSEENLLASDFCGLFGREEQQQIKLLVRQIKKDGTPRTMAAVPLENKWLEMAFVPIPDETGGSVLIIIRDISQALRLEQQLHEASITDDLTGLLNRRGFLTLAEKQLQIAGRSGSRLYLLFADFDDLKKINDHMGHQTGDQALRETGALLRNTFRKSDLIGRIGGDEFAVLLTCFSGDDDHLPVLARLEQNRARQNGESRKYALSFSCGLAKFDPSEPCSLDELISRADEQMYVLKREKKNSGNKAPDGGK